MDKSTAHKNDQSNEVKSYLHVSIFQSVCNLISQVYITRSIHLCSWHTLYVHCNGPLYFPFMCTHNIPPSPYAILMVVTLL